MSELAQPLGVTEVMQRLVGMRVNLSLFLIRTLSKSK